LTALLAALLAIAPLSIDISLAALPGIAGALAGAPGRAGLVVALFLVGFALGQLGYGPASDRFGRRPVLLGALALYLGATLVCLAAPSLEVLLGARFVQGLGACGGPVIARAVVRDLYEPTAGARVLSVAATGMSLAPIVASLAGGLIVSGFGWRGVFVALGGYGVALLASAALRLPETNTQRDHAVFSAAHLLRDYVALAADRRFARYVLTLAAGSVGLFAWISGSPVVLMSVAGLPPHLFGLTFAVVNLGQLGGALLSARLAVRVGIDSTIAVGLALYVVGGVTLAALATAGAQHPLAVAAPMAVFQFGNGLVMPNTVAGAVAPFPRKAGAASALAGFVQMVAGAASGVVLGRLHDGTGRPMAMLVAASALAAALAFRVVGHRRPR
jgi:DHA1 family bicyclomycin/chloramphenicol resistance-like MFS transporter